MDESYKSFMVLVVLIAASTTVRTLQKSEKIEIGSIALVTSVARNSRYMDVVVYETMYIRDTEIKWRFA